MDDIGAAFLFGLGVGLLCLILGCFITYEQAERTVEARWRYEAVIAGHAEYVLSPDGTSTWQWKQAKP